MNKTTPLYDDSLEVQLTDMLCALDEYPTVNINQIGSSAYKGHLLSDTEEGFQKFIHMSLYLKFIEYFDNYKVRCINAYAVRTHFIPVVKRLLSQYNDAIDSLYASPIREEWSRCLDDTRITGKEANLKKQAYQFFFKAAGVQIFYLGKLADKMKEYIAEFETAIPKPEPEYYFTILPAFSSQSHNILRDMHKNLNVKKYVDCTDEAFKKVFTDKEPKPIRWLQSQRSLTYFIKQLTGQFLVEKIKPSNYYIAERYFHIFKNGKYLHPRKLRHDKDPSPEVIEFIDGVIENAIKTYS
ncbi:MAG TPA: hypothetical protein PK496_05205 [Bacteroidales bacterium]|jgi:hypothetical protein|nr:hypothetical protein [Bacteroidales bacterium]HQG78235.1 hypothetical protein [Bacteroidales bacterium]